MSHLHKGTVNLYDSLNPVTISTDLHDQLQALYFKGAGDTTTTNLIHIQKQPNLMDCGRYAIENATEIVFGDAPEENFYDEREREMRNPPTLLFEAEMLVSFPGNKL